MKRNALRVVDAIRDAHGSAGTDDQAVADAFVNLEHDERAGALVRQAHLVRRRPSSSTDIRPILSYTSFALLVDGEHRALGEPIVRTAIQHHHLVLADLFGVVRDGDDLAVDGRGRAHAA